MAQWARALVAQGAARLKVAAVSPARPLPPSLQLGRWFGAGLDFELSSPLPRGARAEAAHLGLRWHSHDCPPLTADTPLEFRKVSPNGFGLLVLPPPPVGKQQSNLKFCWGIEDSFSADNFITFLYRLHRTLLLSPFNLVT